MNPQQQLGYLAGIFDAGASFQVRKRQQKQAFYAVRLHVGMPNPTIATLFQRRFGGKLEFVTDRDRQSGKLCWYSRQQIANLLIELAPYTTHPKVKPMLDFLDCPCDDHMQTAMETVDPWQT